MRRGGDRGKGRKKNGDLTRTPCALIISASAGRSARREPEESSVRPLMENVIGLSVFLSSLPSGFGGVNFLA